MGLLERKLDVDLIARIENGWKPHSIPEPIKKVKPLREGSTYRSALRNQTRRVLRHARTTRLEVIQGRVISPRPRWSGMWPGIGATRRLHRPPVRPNRSPKWDKKND